MALIPMQNLVDFGTRLLVRRGVPLRNAQYIATVAVQAEAFGVTTHGLVQLTAVNGQLGGAINPTAEPRIAKNRGATALIDGEGVIGQLCMKVAKELAVPKAREHGVAMIGIANTSWIAALGIYLIDLARGGFCAQVTAQSSACQDCAPFGGIDARVSTNPIALAFPTDTDPVVADFSTAAVAMGKVMRMIKTGAKADAPIFLDEAGQPTADPLAVASEKGKRPTGSIMFTGGETEGHKGYALSLWCEAMTAMVGGNTNNPKLPQRQSVTLTVIDPEAFAGRARFESEMKRLTAWLKSSRVREGFDRIRLPGERGFETLRRAEREGVPVPEAMVAQLNQMADEQGVPRLTTAAS